MDTLLTLLERCDPGPHVACRGLMPRHPLAGDDARTRQVQWVAERPVLRTTAVVAATNGLDAALEGATALREGAKLPRALVDAVGARGLAFDERDRAHAHSQGGLRNAIVRLAREYDTIRAMPKVASVTMTPEHCIVTTNRLIVVEGGQAYDIGCWEIRLPRIGTDVRIFSAPKKVVDGWQHPHVDASGNLCWGNVKGELMRALEEGDLDTAIVFFVALLETGVGREQDREFHLKMLRSIGTAVAMPTAARAGNGHG